MAIKPKIKIPLQYGPTGKQPNQPIFASTPEGKNIWEDMAGLYYRVKDKLDKLQKAMNYPIITNVEDNRMIEGILLKFDMKNKISADDMRTCNELWKKYGK